MGGIDALETRVRGNCCSPPSGLHIAAVRYRDFGGDSDSIDLYSPARYAAYRIAGELEAQRRHENAYVFDRADGLSWNPDSFRWRRCNGRTLTGLKPR
jgi:hypothetical protein